MKVITSLMIFLAGGVTHAQTVITLEECYARAAVNYPQLRQSDIIDQTRKFSVENAVAGNLPRIVVGGQGTWQSEVTRIPIDVPGVEPLSKDQYKVFGEINQTLYQGGMIAAQRHDAEINSEVEAKGLEVEMYQLRKRINDLFFGILLLTEQVKQSALAKKDLNASLEKLEASVINGTALPGAVDVMRAELLRVEQRIIEMKAAERGYRNVLGQFINEQPMNHILQRPEFTDFTSAISRPELALFDLQERSIASREVLLSAQRKPGVQLFLQTGYGRPGLNMLENEFDFYYLGGIRFSWLLSGYYTFKKEKQILSLRRQSLEIQKETFLFNTELLLTQDETEIQKLRRLIEVDNEIIMLRTRIRETAGVQLEEGVITATDYVQELNAEDQAKLNRALHETQLLKSQAEYYFTSGQELKTANK